MTDTLVVRVASAPDTGLVALLYGRDDGGVYRYGLTRYDSAGRPDVAFGVAGTATIDASALPGLVLADLSVASDGAITLVGTAPLTAPGVSVAQDMIVVLRRVPDGAPDTGFADAGVLTLALGDAARGRGILATSAGMILFGQTAPTGTGRLAGVLARFNSTTGALDPTFGLGGSRVQVSVAQPGAAELRIDEIQQTASGDLLGFGAVDGAGMAWRWSKTGTPDPGFGTGGELVLSAAGQIARVVGGGGRLYSLIEEGVGDARVLAVTAFNDNGQPVAEYGVQGRAAITLGASNVLQDARVRSDASLYVLLGPRAGGVTALDLGRAQQIATAMLLRLANDGTLDTAVAMPIDGAGRLVDQPDGALLVVAGGDVVRLAPAPVYRLTLPLLQRP